MSPSATRSTDMSQKSKCGVKKQITEYLHVGRTEDQRGGGMQIKWRFPPENVSPQRKNLSRKVAWTVRTEKITACRLSGFQGLSMLTKTARCQKVPVTKRPDPPLLQLAFPHHRSGMQLFRTSVNFIESQAPFNLSNI